MFVCGNPTNGNDDCSGDGPHGSTCTSHTFNVVNANPVAVDDGTALTPFFSVTEDDDALVIRDDLNRDVLENDTDIDSGLGDTKAVNTFFTGSTIGTVLPGAGSFTYNPNSEFEHLDTNEFEIDSFTYTVIDNNGGISDNAATVYIKVNGVNDAPVANLDSIEMNIGATATTLVGGNTSVLTNDTDVDIEPLTAVLETPPLFGSLSLNSNGTFSYTHNGSNNLVDSFTYRASDDGGITANSNLATVSIAVNNTPPTANSDPNVATVEEGGSVNFTVLGNDTDPETGFASAVVNVGNQTNGTVTVEANQSITFSHDGSETTSASFTYQASDGFLTSVGTATVTLIVTPTNDAPVITEDAAITVNMTEDTPSSFVLTLNATDAENNNLSWDILTPATSGTATTTAGTGNSNVISYTPDLNLAGNAADSFVVRVTDDGTPSQSDTITVTVNIAGVDDPPQITLANATDVSLLNNFSVTMSEDGAPTLFNLVLNATDPEGDAINWILPNGAGAIPSNGTVSLSATPTGPSQVISYTPDADFNGSDSFVVRTTANALTDSLRINVTIDPVNDAPVINAGAASTTVSMTEDLPGTFLLTLTATDVDSTNLSWDIVTAAGNGTATATGLGASKVIGYTPNPNLVGISADSFVVRVTDDGIPSQSDTITVSVDIAGVDDPPVITEGAAIGVSMSEDSAPNPFSLTLNATDADNDPISWSIQTAAANGVASASGTGLSQVISYVPNANFNGVDSFEVRATANAVSTTITVTVTVAAVDDAPVITDGAALTVDGSEDTTLIRQLTATDAEGGVLTWSIPGVVTNGQASVSSTGEFSFTPDLNFVGQGSFQVRVTDSTNLSATISITVNVLAVNIPPVISQVSPVNVVMNEDDPASFSLTLNATDQDNDVISWSILTQATNGTAAATGTGTSKAIAYVPNTDFNGSDSFVVLATANGQTDSITVNVTVNPVDDAPVITSGGLDVASVLVGMSEDSSPTPFILTLGATDADGGDLSWSVITTGTIGSASASGIGASKAIVYTPNLNQTGADSFVVQVTDNSALTDSITVNVNITAVDDGPTIAEGASTTVVMSEDGNPTPFSLSLNASDPEGDAISWSISSAATNGTASVPAGAGTSKAISYLPNANFSGSDSFVVQVSSNALTAAITVNVTVNPVNDAPVISEGASIAVSMSEDSTPSAFALTLNATDVEASELTWDISSSSTNGVATVTGTGNSKAVSYTPNLNYAGSDSFVVRVTDAAALSDTITVNVTVSPVDDAPVISEGASVNVSMSEDGSPTAFALTLNASDPEADLISWDILTPAGNGSATVAGSGLSKLISYTPNANFNGADSFVVRTTANALTDSITVNVTVQAVNDIPVITQGASITINISEDNSPNAFALTLNASDADNTTLTWSISAAATSGSAAVSAIPTGNSQAISYTPNADFNGTDTFTVQVSDGVDTASFIVNVNISAINDAPVISEGVSVPITMSEDGVPNPFALTLNALDAEGDSISWSIDTAPTNGTADVSTTPTGLTQAISYTPTLEFSGSDSFIVKASDGILSSTITVNVTVIITNDAPQLADIADVIVDESVAMPVITALGSDPDDANDGVALTYSLTTAPAGMVISNALATLGEISWTPPQTGEFNKQYAVTVSVADGGEDGVAPASKSFSVFVNPPDADGDQVADYDDFCPAIADSTNADTDGDGTAGSDSDPDDSVGGNACDNDDDNDGMSDLEEIANNFDPLDASDADQDADGDGISNLDEVLAGTNPRTATITIDATGYLTPYTLLPPTPALIHDEATIVTADKRGPWRPGQYLITWFASNRVNGNLGSTQQTLNVRPLINLDADQFVAEGSSGAVRVSLNGDAPAYPVLVNYTVSGTASSADHDAASGSLSLTAQSRSALISFNVLADTLNDANETIVFSLDSVTNAVIGSKPRHTATISETNVAPRVSLRFVQNGRDVSSGFVADGEVTVTASATDVNTGQTLSYNWQNSANALLAPADLLTPSWTFTPSSGTYVIDVRVADNGIPAQQTRVKRLFKVSLATPPLLGTDDTDGDGIADDVEGYGDSDNDGIPDYLDAQSEGELLPDQSVILLNSRLLQTQQGLKLNIGNTALAAGIAGASITDEDILNFGDDSGSAPLNALDEFDHLSGVYDFEISQMIPGASVQLVIPLQSAIPRDARYRKFDPLTGWTDFVVDASNSISSSAGQSGVCPEPGSDQYQVGLNYLHNCLQLQIQDGGPNDQDGEANGVVRDPGTLGIKLSEPQTPVVQEGGALSTVFLISLWLLVLFRLRQRYYQHAR